MVRDEYIAEWVLRAQKIAHLGIWDQDPVSDKLWWSDETFRILGLEPKSIAPSFAAFLQMVHPEDRLLIVKHTELALQSADYPYKVEYRIIRPDQSVRIVHEEAIIERDEQGTPTKITGIIQDITERKQVEKEKEKLINELQQAIKEIKTLKGIIPICAYCKKIRDDKGAWDIFEAYVCERTDAEFSHGICPDCHKREMENLLKGD